MDTQAIKNYALELLKRNERLPDFERTSSYWEDELRLRQLWLQAEQAEQLARIATAVELLERR